MAKGKVLETIINIGGEISPTLGKTLDGVASKLEGVKGKALLFGTAATGAVIGTVAAVSKGVSYLGDLGAQFDNAFDSIRIGTGATGDALEALTDDFNEVYKNVPTSMEDASQAIADFNTRLGLTGPELQGISTQAIQVSDMLGDDLGRVIEESSQAFQQWGLSSADMSESMDYIFKVSQSTGMGFSDLMSNMQSFGPQLQAMGYSFEESAALMGQMEKAGVNTEEVLGAMKKSVGTLAKDGISATKVMSTYAEKIKNAGSEAEAAGIANEIFGTRAGSTMAAAIRDGTMDVESLTKSLIDNQETIQGAAEDTYDWAETFQMIKQQAEVSLQPLAGVIFDTFSKIAPVIGQLFEKLGPIFEQTLALAMPFVEEFLGGAMSFLGELMPMISSLAEALLPLLFDLVGSLLPPLLDLAQALIPPFIEILQAILPPIVGILGALMPILIQIVQMILPVAVEIINGLMPTIVSVLDILVMLLETAVLPLLDPIMMLVESLLPVIAPLVDALFASLKPGLALLEKLAPVLETIIGWIAKVVGWVADGLNWVVKLIFGDEASEIADAAEVNGYAAGGLTNGLSIAGEDPRYPHEWVISLNPAYRDENLSYWAQAGRMLGADVSDFTLGGGSNDSYVDIGGITFAPNITITGSADKDDIMEAIEESYPEFIDMLEEWFAKRGVPVYG